MGLVLGRVLGGVIADLASWRDTYWLAVGAQGGEYSLDLLWCSRGPGANSDRRAGMLLLAWLGLPDTPHKDIGLSYLGLVSRGKWRMRVGH